jgi:hypothetical protein
MQEESSLNFRLVYSIRVNRLFKLVHRTIFKKLCRSRERECIRRAEETRSHKVYKIK